MFTYGLRRNADGFLKQLQVKEHVEESLGMNQEGGLQVFVEIWSLL